MMMRRFVYLLAVATMAVAHQASADDCKSPKVKVVNDRTESIKITKIQYFDGCDNVWRTENVAETEIRGAQGNTLYWAEFTDNLEYVGGSCAIPKFKVYRAIRKQTGKAYGPYQWGSELVPDEGTQQACNTNVRYTIHAHE